MVILQIIGVYLAGGVVCTFLFGWFSTAGTVRSEIVIAASLWPITLPIWIFVKVWGRG